MSLFLAQGYSLLIMVEYLDDEEISLCHIHVEVPKQVLVAPTGIIIRVLNLNPCENEQFGFSC